MIVPCKDCGSREIGCHSKCEKYLEFKDFNERRKKERELDKKCNDLNFDSIAKTMKKKYGNPKWKNPSGHPFQLSAK